MSSNPIGVLDSGVGGLSVLLEVKMILPEESLIYVADQEFSPYGTKTEEELVDRVGKILEFFQSRNVKAVVIACNTATVHTIDEMRLLFDFPIIGTVPVVKTIASITKSGKTAVLSTPSTSKSSYLDYLIDEFAKGVEVERVGGSNLEEFVEKGELDSVEVREILRKVLNPLVEKNVDSVALGCTHYPFLKSEMEKIAGSKVNFVDSGGAVARRLKQILELNSDLSLQKGKDEYYTTGNVKNFNSVANKLTNLSIKPKSLNL